MTNEEYDRATAAERDKILATMETMATEIRHLRGAMAAQDERNLAATERLGLPPAGCDTPDHLADEIESLRNDRDGAKYALGLANTTIEHLSSFQANASHAHRLEIAEIMAEQEQLRRQRDELHAANNRLLEERRTAELVTFLVAKAQWSLATFGPGMRTEGICRHIEKELIEIRAKPFDLVEWVDVFMLAVDGFWRAWWASVIQFHPTRKLDSAELQAMAEIFIREINVKHAANVARQWPEPTGQDQPVEHIR